MNPSLLERFINKLQEECRKRDENVYVNSEDHFFGTQVNIHHSGGVEKYLLLDMMGNMQWQLIK